MTAALEGGEWSAGRLGCTLPPGKTRYPFYRSLGGPQGRYGRAENLVPTGIRSRTVQPVALSLYRLSYRAMCLVQFPKQNPVLSYPTVTNRSYQKQLGTELLNITGINPYPANVEKMVSS